jgi:PleD family two-component response regulator
MSEKQKYTVLVVEDVDEISLNMGAALSKRGHQVVHAATAAQAMLIAEENRPTMILTDFDLPTFDELLKSLRGHDALKSMLVAVIDINNPTVRDASVSVLPDFQALDDLMDASSDGTSPQS